MLIKWSRSLIILKKVHFGFVFFTLLWTLLKYNACKLPCCAFPARERIVGWYHTGPKLHKNDIAINELIKQYCTNSVWLLSISLENTNIKRCTDQTTSDWSCCQILSRISPDQWQAGWQTIFWFCSRSFCKCVPCRTTGEDAYSHSQLKLISQYASMKLWVRTL